MKGFSLIELLVSLIVISIILAAIAPTFNKHLKTNAVSLNNKMTKNCAAYGFDNDCQLCWGKDMCAVCLKGCLESQTLNNSTCKCE